MNEPRTEAALQRRVWRAVAAKYPDVWIFHPVGSPFQLPGIPDLLFCIEGKFVALELKHQHPGESLSHAMLRVTPQQQRQIDLINVAGGQAAVVTNVSEALDVIERALTQ
jgi:hypothetical protein